MVLGLSLRQKRARMALLANCNQNGHIGEPITMKTKAISLTILPILIITRASTVKKATVLSMAR